MFSSRDDLERVIKITRQAEQLLRSSEELSQFTPPPGVNVVTVRVTGNVILGTGSLGEVEAYPCVITYKQKTQWHDLKNAYVYDANGDPLIVGKRYKAHVTQYVQGYGLLETTAIGGGGSIIDPYCSGPGWVAGLDITDCLTLTFTGAAGRCSSIDITQVITGMATSDDANWFIDSVDESHTVSFTATGTWAVPVTVVGNATVTAIGGGGGGAGATGGSTDTQTVALVGGHLLTILIGAGGALGVAGGTTKVDDASTHLASGAGGTAGSGSSGTPGMAGSASISYTIRTNVINICGVLYRAVFDREPGNPGPPNLSLTSGSGSGAHSYVMKFNCATQNCVTFWGGDSTICTGTKGDNGPVGNAFSIQICVGLCGTIQCQSDELCAGQPVPKRLYAQLVSESGTGSCTPCAVEGVGFSLDYADPWDGFALPPAWVGLTGWWGQVGFVGGGTCRLFNVFLSCGGPGVRVMNAEGVSATIVEGLAPSSCDPFCGEFIARFGYIDATECDFTFIVSSDPTFDGCPSPISRSGLGSTSSGIYSGTGSATVTATIPSVTIPAGGMLCVKIGLCGNALVGSSSLTFAGNALSAGPTSPQWGPSGFGVVQTLIMYYAVGGSPVTGDIVISYDVSGAGDFAVLANAVEILGLAFNANDSPVNNDTTGFSVSGASATATAIETIEGAVTVVGSSLGSTISWDGGASDGQEVSISMGSGQFRLTSGHKITSVIEAAPVMGSTVTGALDGTAVITSFK